MCVYRKTFKLRLNRFTKQIQTHLLYAQATIDTFQLLYLKLIIILVPLLNSFNLTEAAIF